MKSIQSLALASAKDKKYKKTVNYEHYLNQTSTSAAAAGKKSQ